MINNNFDLNNKGVSNAIQTVDLPRHRWYFYKEGFSPELVEAAVKDKKLTNKDFIVDPFNGSGTVTLSAATLGIPSLGFEVNPFTSFLAKAKTLTPSKIAFKDAIERTLEGCQKEGLPSYLESYSTFTPHNRPGKKEKEKWLFNTEVIRAFNAGLNLHNGNRSYVSQLMRLALITAAMGNCNGKRDGKCLRYKNKWQDLSYGKSSFLKSFEIITNKIVEDIEEPILISPMIINGDSRKLVNKMEKKFKLCITSPPYLNTFDYTDIYRPELFLGQFITTSDELYKLRFKTIRSHVQVKWDRAKEKNFGIIYQEVYDKIHANQEALMNKNILPMIAAYFEDLKGVLKSLRSKAEDDASLWFVVSTSAYANEHVPVDLILADVATQVGWKFREIGVLREIRKRKTVHSPDINMLRESVVILDADSAS